MLGSSSAGNATLVDGGDALVLVDAGLSTRQISLRMEALGYHLADLDAVLITHEHGDHVSALRVMMKKHPIPVHANKKTFGGFDSSIIPTKNEFSTGSSFYVSSLHITAFPVSHGAADPVGFFFNDGEEKALVATDSGQATKELLKHAKGCQTYVIESNYDTEMLMDGSYPFFLKQKISGPFGHMSNDDCGMLLVDSIEDNDPRVILAHLSKDNNTPQKALETVNGFLERTGKKARVEVCSR